MKKTIAMVLAAALAIASVSAQGFGPGMGRQMAPTDQNAQITKIEGKLALVNGHPGIVIKDKTYYVAIPGHLYGFIDGLKEGAQVKLEGYENTLPIAPNYSFFRVTKLTLNGKDYDLSQFGQGEGCPMGGRKGGRGDNGMMGPGMGGRR